MATEAVEQAPTQRANAVCGVFIVSASPSGPFTGLHMAALESSSPSRPHGRAERSRAWNPTSGRRGDGQSKRRRSNGRGFVLVWGVARAPLQPRRDASVRRLLHNSPRTRIRSAAASRALATHRCCWCKEAEKKRVWWVGRYGPRTWLSNQRWRRLGRRSTFQYSNQSKRDILTTACLAYYVTAFSWSLPAIFARNAVWWLKRYGKS